MRRRVSYICTCLLLSSWITNFLLGALGRFLLPSRRELDETILVFRRSREAKDAHNSDNVVFKPPYVLMKHGEQISDYGGLDILRSRNENSGGGGREIRANDAKQYEAEREAYFERIGKEEGDDKGPFYADDADYASSLTGEECVKPSWIYNMLPTCNVFHERASDPSLTARKHRYLGSGFSREAWLLSKREKVVLKRQRFGRPYSRARLFKIKHEALLQERLGGDTAMQIYGYCGTSVLTEFGTKIESVVKQRDPLQKVQIALSVSESIAAMHGMAVIAQDIKLDQWLQTRRGIKLNDFDQAVALGWNRDGDYCQHTSNFLGGIHAPESVRGEPVDTSTDMWKLAGIFFSILRGEAPYQKTGRRQRLKAIANGKPPTAFADNMVFKDPMESRLSSIMDQCYQAAPEDRADIFEVVQYLKETVNLHKG